MDPAGTGLGIVGSRCKRYVGWRRGVKRGENNYRRSISEIKATSDDCVIGPKTIRRKVRFVRLQITKGKRNTGTGCMRAERRKDRDVRQMLKRIRPRWIDRSPRPVEARSITTANPRDHLTLRPFVSLRIQFAASVSCVTAAYRPNSDSSRSLKLSNYNSDVLWISGRSVTR